MKKLLKSVVCGTYEQCTGALFMGEKSKSYSLEKKKKSETQTCVWEAQNVLPKRTLNPCDFTVYALKKKKKKKRQKTQTLKANVYPNPAIR